MSRSKSAFVRLWYLIKHDSGITPDAIGDAVLRQTLEQCFEQVKKNLKTIVIGNFLDSTFILQNPTYVPPTAEAELSVLGMLIMISLFLTESLPNFSTVFLEACFSSPQAALADQNWLTRVAPDEMKVLALLPADPRHINPAILTNSTLIAQSQILGLTVSTSLYDIVRTFF